jgi:hypothetical protein
MEKSNQLTTKKTILPAAGDDYIARYLDATAPTAIAGRLVRYDGKKGIFTFHDDGSTVPTEITWVPLREETMIAWVKFGKEGEPPDRRGGLLSEGYQLPLRQELGDLDEAEWPEGLNGAVEDPWRHETSIVLQRQDTGELATFSTMSKTGRRAISTLLQTYRRNKKTAPGTLPVIQLVSGSYKHERFGEIAIPILKVVGKTSVENAAGPDERDLPNDSIPF